MFQHVHRNLREQNSICTTTGLVRLQTSFGRAGARLVGQMKDATREATHLCPSERRRFTGRPQFILSFGCIERRCRRGIGDRAYLVCQSIRSVLKVKSITAGLKNMPRDSTPVS
jgi:hypothetical protein